jgi:hypothetical protein
MPPLQADLNKKMRDATNKVVCKDGHEHAVCCGGNKDNEESEA